ncbi:MAG: M23 family metallopeptidase [bacterium]|nr:M23 family metallopeptidase [bacterium]
MQSKLGRCGSFGNHISLLIGFFALFLIGRVSAEHNFTCHLPEGPIVLYEDRFSDDRLSQGWNTMWSWGGIIVPWITQSTPGGQGGTYALKADVGESTGGGLEIHTDWGKSVFTTGRTVLAFSFRKEMDANVRVGIRDSSGTVPTYVLLSSYIAPNQDVLLVNGQWYSFVIPLSDLQSVNKALGGVVFTTNAPGTMYVDNVMILNIPPNFKLPLPGNKNWLLTVEAGGKAFDGSDDTNHYEQKAYFSLDFDDTSQEVGQETDVKVLASAGGKVVFTSTTEDQYNGYYVVIDHDGDGNLKTGYSTWYAHMKKDSILVSAGNTVTQGQQLGIIGNTGDSAGTHLHFGIQYNNKKWLKKANGSVDEETALFLRIIKIEGRKIEEYKVGVGSSDPAGYYPSTNVQ